MIKFCLSLLAGAYALHCTSFASPDVLFPLAAIGAAIALLAGGRRAAAGCLLGLTLFILHAHTVITSRLAAQYEGDSMLAVLQVVDFPRRTGSSISFLARPLGDRRIPPRLRVSWFEAPESPAIGDVWQFEVRLRRPRGTSNPGVFDYEAWLFRQRIAATGYVVSGPRNQRLLPAAGDRVSRLRQHIVRRIDDVIENERSAAVVAAISVGARHGITPDQWLRYSRSGTSHLMAISGLHVGLAASAAWFVAAAICALLRSRGNHLKVAWTASIVTAGCYASLSGFAVPAQRATLMLLLVAIAMLLSREPRPVAILAAACCLVTLLDPLATLAPGFQLSFTAVLLLLWFARRQAITRARSRIARLLAGGLQLAAVQVFLLFGLTPLTVANFSRVALVAPAVNFVAVPVFSVVTVPFTLAGVLLDGALATFGDTALGIAAASIDLLHRLIELALAVPHGALDTATSAVGNVSIGIILAWAVLPRAWPGRHVALIGLLALISARVDGPARGCADVRMLDVGQGLAVVVRTQQRTLLYDTGAAFPGGSDMASRVVLPYLSAQGIRRIDRLVVSHSDVDHSGGAARILADMEVGDVLVGEPGALPAATACRRGRAWRWDGVDFRVLHPGAGERHAGNDASCVLLVAAGDAGLLLTGDVEAGVERMLVASGVPGKVDAVVVPHHGSSTSSSDAFVRFLAADLALVSAGYRNRWELPRPEVVERWYNAAASVLVTAHDGAIGFRLCGDSGITNLVVNREHSRRVWHEPPAR